ncbi:MAG: hypothetical protein AAGA56_19595, partial [Myxococcota bacterium]
RGKSKFKRDRFAPLHAIAKIYDLLAPEGEALVTVPFGRLTDGGWWIQFSTEYVKRLTTHLGLPRNAVKLAAIRRDVMQLLQQNKTSEAFPLAQQLVRAAPGDAFHYLFLGATLQAQGRGAEAHLAYDACAKLAKTGPLNECFALGGRR